MDKRRVVITGLGIVSNVGIGKDAFMENIFKGVSGIKPISTFDTGPFKAKLAGEAGDFVPEEILGAKGLRTFDRSTKLAASAAKLALLDSSLEITEANSRDCGVSLGTTLGSVSSICDFDKAALIEGVRYVNPAFFPNTVINSPASQVSIKFNIKGFNITIATGFSSSLDAISYGLGALRFGRAKIVLSGGVEEFCVQTFLGFYKTGCLSGLQEGSLEISSPFDQRRNGVILGEGSAIAVLEELDSAIKRKAGIYAEVLGFGISRQDFRKSMRMSLEESGLSPDEIDYLASSANSSREFDLKETEAIKEVFGKKAQTLPISSVKSMIGECYSASGALQVASAVGALQKQSAPPTINYRVKDQGCDLDYVVNKSRPLKIENILINAGGARGNNSSLIISRFKGY